MGIYSGKMKTLIWKDMCTPVSVSALFIMAKTWKQLSVQQQMNDKENVVHVYNGILLGHKKEWDHVICNHLDGWM